MTRDRVGGGERPEEDERTADWIHLLVTRPRDAVVVGIGWGAVPAALARAGARVVAVDGSSRRLAFMDARATQDGLAVRCTAAIGQDGIPVEAASADLLALLEPVRATPGEIARMAGRILRPGGELVWQAVNAWRPRGAGGATLSAYTTALHHAGFHGVRVYAAVPDRGVPLFHVPLHDAGALGYFLRALLPLAATASPEARARYGVLARAVELGPLAARIPFVTSVARYLAPRWLLFAQVRTGGAG